MESITQPAQSQVPRTPNRIALIAALVAGGFVYADTQPADATAHAAQGSAKHAVADVIPRSEIIAFAKDSQRLLEWVYPSEDYFHMICNKGGSVDIDPNLSHEDLAAMRTAIGTYNNIIHRYDSHASANLFAKYEKDRSDTRKFFGSFAKAMSHLKKLSPESRTNLIWFILQEHVRHTSKDTQYELYPPLIRTDATLQERLDATFTARTMMYNYYKLYDLQQSAHALLEQKTPLPHITPDEKNLIYNVFSKALQLRVKDAEGRETLASRIAQIFTDPKSLSAAEVASFNNEAHKLFEDIDNPDAFAELAKKIASYIQEAEPTQKLQAEDLPKSVVL